MSTDFQKQPLEKRKNDYEKLSQKFPDKIPIIVSKHKKSKLDNLPKDKFLVPDDITVIQFLSILRTKLKMEPSDSLWLFVNGNMIGSRENNSIN